MNKENKRGKGKPLKRAGEALITCMLGILILRHVDRELSSGALISIRHWGRTGTTTATDEPVIFWVFISLEFGVALFAIAIGVYKYLCPEARIFSKIQGLLRRVLPVALRG